MWKTFKNPQNPAHVENNIVDNFEKNYKNIIKSLFFLDLTGFFVIIEMVFFRAEEVDRYENDIPAKKET